MGKLIPILNGGVMKKKKDKVDMMQVVFYGTIRPEKAQQIADGSMISEGRDSIANLSTKEINKIFNPNRFTEKLIDAC